MRNRNPEQFHRCWLAHLRAWGGLPALFPRSVFESSIRILIAPAGPNGCSAGCPGLTKARSRRACRCPVPIRLLFPWRRRGVGRAEPGEAPPPWGGSEGGRPAPRRGPEKTPARPIRVGRIGLFGDATAACRNPGRARIFDFLVLRNRNAAGRPSQCPLSRSACDRAAIRVTRRSRRRGPGPGRPVLHTHARMARNPAAIPGPFTRRLGHPSRP